jgi:hypothetical protein
MDDVHDMVERQANRPARAGASPLVIVGSPRSGTTFLTRTINRFLDIHVARDGGVFVRFHKALPAYGGLADPADMRRLIDDLYQDVMFRTRFLERGLNLSQAQLDDALTERSFPGLVRQVFIETARSRGKQYWGNKRPSYALHFADLDAIFPGAKIVHIVRDGRDVVLSMRKASHLLVEKNWYFAASDWNEHVRLARRAGQELGRARYLEIKYENLLANPVEVFQTILEFMGTGPDSQRQLEKVRAGITRRIRANNHDKWRTQMPEKAIRVVERVAGDLLKDLGYPLQFPEEAGKGFNSLQIGMFSMDRFVRNVFMRDQKKFVSAHFNELASATRARLGSFRTGKRTRVGKSQVAPKSKEL